MASQISGGWQSAKHRTTVYMVLVVVGISILFDGYDLVIYGAVLSTLLEDPTQIGALSPAVAGTLGSYAMIGVMIGALSAGAVGDRLGRRKVMLTAIVWFSVGMALTAFASSIALFGFLRFLTGLGVGMIVATGGAIIAEFAPANRRNLFNAIVYSGVPAGGVLASILALLFEDVIGWRGLFLIGGSPLLFLLPLAYFFLPESPRWLTSRGRAADAKALCARYGLPTEEFVVEKQQATKGTGFAGIFSSKYLMGTILIGAMSFIGLLSTYGLTSNFFGTECRAAGVAWCAGFGRLGGIVGPAIGGLIIGAGFGPSSAFLIFAAAAAIGAVCTLLIPRSPAEVEVKVAQEPLARV